MIRVLLITACLMLTQGYGYAEELQSKPFVYSDNGKRDPFMPLVTSSGVMINTARQYTLGDLNLEGIVSGGSGNIAIINGVVLEAGQKMGDFLIKEINNDNVILLKGAQESVLRLKKEE